MLQRVDDEGDDGMIAVGMLHCSALYCPRDAIPIPVPPVQLKHTEIVHPWPQFQRPLTPFR